jgi:uncharacterized protein YbbC (DUF1343 family)
MTVRLGIDGVCTYANLFQNRNIGFITNYSGVDSHFTENIAVFLKNGYNITKIFAPEHGIYGIADGEGFSDFTHPVYAIPVISLYGEKLKPSANDLEGIDLLVYDIQDVGLRYYTFIYTLAYCLEAASEYKIPFIVLDRPNPLGGTIISGNRIPKEYSSFVGGFRLPIRYGLTPGELARYFVRESNLKTELSVIPMENYTRTTYHPDTGLFWNLPSPAIPSFESAVCYNAGCFVEGTNLSEGRGSAKPFQMYGAPWLHMERLYTYLSSFNDQGFAFRTRAFVPFSSKYKDSVCFGLEFFPKYKEADFTRLLLTFLKGVAQEHPDAFALTRYADVERLESLTGDIRVRDFLWGNTELEELMSFWEIQAKEFEEEVSSLRIYH